MQTVECCVWAMYGFSMPVRTVDCFLHDILPPRSGMGMLDG